MAKKLTRKEKIALQQQQAKSDSSQTSTSPKKNLSAPAAGKLTRTLAFIIAAFAFLLYANTLSHQYARDDYSIILENVMTKKGTSALKEIMTTTYRTGYSNNDYELYRPLSKAIFAIELSFADDIVKGNPGFGHWVHVIFYALTGFALFYVLSLYLNGNLLFAFLASSLFMAHPIHTEVAANIKSLDEMLCFLFFIGSLFFIYHYLQRSAFKFLVLAALSFFLALLSKESAVTFLAVVPLMIWFFTKAPSSKNIAVTVTLVVVAGIFLAIRAGVIAKAADALGGGKIVAGGVSVADNLLAGQDGAHRFATAVYIMGIYLKQLFYPAVLVSDRSLRDIPVVDMGDWRFLLSFAIYTALGIYAIIRLKKKDPVSFGILYFFITASVASNIPMLIGTSYGERLMYSPSLGFCIAIAALLVRFARNEAVLIASASLGDFFRTYAKPIGLAAVILVLYSFRTITRNPDWRDNIALALADVKDAPNSTRSHFYLGNALSQDEYLNTRDSSERKMLIDSANNELLRAVKIYPQYADAWQQIGKNYSSLRDFTKAEEYYKKALEINPTNPLYLNNFGYLQFNMASENVGKGIKLLQAKQDSAAQKYFQEAGRQYETARLKFEESIRWNPLYTDAYNNLGASYGTLGENLKAQGRTAEAKDAFEKAIFNFSKVIELDPTRTGAYLMIANTYRNMGDNARYQENMNKYNTGGK